MIKVLIVEDDPMVAEFNKRYLKEIKGFSLLGIVHNVKDAKEFLEKEKVNLILLDVYMPGTNGLELLHYIREQKMAVDVILISAAADTDKIQTALRLGVTDYLIKPFEFERFSQAMEKYKDKSALFERKQVLNQEDLDDRILHGDQRASGELAQVLPKGLTNSTLQNIINVIKSKDGTLFSTDEIAESTYISRVSVRKYLKYLTQLGVLEESLTYGIGRPVYFYTLKKDKLKQISMYL
ncbi:response regulator of citrate/malate metabolism [Neobacillus niacini]|jgi:two-component system, CitB family, response regulator MalR|uniref:response regulator n=1 Tax=Neobacillus niacini TaxID=86668 RepID=UPI002786A450|nr:response regulator [Neobacillus niacini]MDQ1004650.1 response regulator of citrate/malate metabolism [Neobacillus niacini]